MIILSFKTGHDPAACLLEDGKLIAAVEEERFVRVKHASDYFPEHAIRYCLSVRGVTLDQVDHIVFAREKNIKTFFKVLWYFLTRLPRNYVELRYALSLMAVQLRGVAASLTGRAPYQKLFRMIGGKKRRIYSFDHHTVHAASAYYGSGFESAAILVMDGKGEATSISLWEGKNGSLRLLKKYGIFDSLGYVYGSITDFLGFRMNDGEYKVMGLAPYGKPAYPFDDVIAVRDQGVFINTRYSLYPFSLKGLMRRFPGLKNDYSESAPPQPNTDIAATLQERLERAALWYVKKLVSLASEKESFCFAGGVALNVKMNKAIWESGIARRMWIQPAAGDMGNVLGAAWMLWREKSGMRPEALGHLYLGPEYADADIKNELAASGFSHRFSEDVSGNVARMLSEGKIVAWFQGRCEFGPRALGARSVLADPRRAEMKDIINAKVKFREPFRPFCPSFLEGHGNEIFEHYMSSPFMVMSFRAKPEWREKLGAVTHIDGTLRPQEVFEKTNSAYARMIRAFYELTGVPVVLNTSLNVKGEPIVNTPAQAVAFFKKTDVDVLAIGSYLAFKT